MPQTEETIPATRRTTPHATPTPDRIVHGVNIDREWRLWKEVVPSMSCFDRLHRTSYFFKREAIAWTQHALRGTLMDRETCRKLALYYRARHTQSKGGVL